MLLLFTLLITVFTPTAALASPVQMSTVQMSTVQVSSELEFLAAMVPHHRDAVADARTALTRSQRPEVRRLAQRMIDAQKAEIAQLEAWLAAWYPRRDRAQAAAKMDMSMAGMATLENLAGDPFERAFLEGMVAHHRAAVQMVDSLLGQNLVEHAEVRTLAQSIKTSQEAEIEQMQGWLDAWFTRR